MNNNNFFVIIIIKLEMKEINIVVGVNRNYIKPMNFIIRKQQRIQDKF